MLLPRLLWCLLLLWLLRLVLQVLLFFLLLLLLMLLLLLPPLQLAPSISYSSFLFAAPQPPTPGRLNTAIKQSMRVHHALAWRAPLNTVFRIFRLVDVTYNFVDWGARKTNERQREVFINTVQR